MRVTSWAIMVATSVMLSIGSSLSVLAAPPSQNELPLEVTIATARAEVIAGAPMTWRVTLTPHGEQNIGSVELRPGDTRVWAWPDGIQAIEAITNPVVLDVSAVPLVSGKLIPTVEARYMVGEEMQTQLATADAPVQVEPVETHVEAAVIAGQGTARQNAPLIVELSIHNHSPFTLTQVRVEGNGVDLAWNTPTALQDIRPNETFRQELIAAVEGQHPQPQLSIDYTWSDSVGTLHAHALYVSGAPVALEESITSGIPLQLVAVVAGVLTGALATIIPGLIDGWLSRRRQRKANRQHVHGLLRLMTLQSEHAADSGALIEVEPLETIFKEEGLFAIVEEDGLAQSVRNLWTAAERHNKGLNLPGGAQRSEELRLAAQELAKKDERTGWIERLRHWAGVRWGR